MKIKDLKPAKYNPRKISKKEIDKLKMSINEYGLVQNIVVNKDFTIIGGHQRIEACAQRYSILKKGQNKPVQQNMIMPGSEMIKPQL